MKHNWRRIMTATIASLLVVVLLASFAMSCIPSQVEAVKNRQIDGMIIWGTSGVSRMYGDLVTEQYTEEESSKAKYEAAQHLWASYHNDSGVGYGYYNYGLYTNYWVKDARNFAMLPNGSNGFDSSSMRVSSNQKTLDAITPQIDKAISTGTNGSVWDVEKTAIVIWAGEDWVVRNADSNDVGVSGYNAANLLEHLWMGQDVEPYRPTGYSGQADYSFFNHTFNPLPGVNSVDPAGDVMHSYKDDHGSTDVSRTESIVQPVGSHYGKEGEEVDHCEDDYPNVTENSRLNGNSGASGYHHSYVHNNSYQITEAHLGQWEDGGDGHHETAGSGFSYNVGQDGIDVVLDHAVNDPTDKLDDDQTLGQQSGESLARMISGYTYRVEYLVQDESKSSEIEDELQTIEYWKGVLVSEHDETLPSTTTTTSSDTLYESPRVNEYDTVYNDPSRNDRPYDAHVVETTVLDHVEVEDVDVTEEVTCTLCHGDKKITCTNCGGSGTQSGTCRVCNGRGWNCPGCDNTGKITCYTCGGDGRIGVTNKICFNCGGSGKLTCEDCGGSPRSKTCARCGGSGQVNGRCTVCSGTGKITCTLCRGTGKILQSSTGHVYTYYYVTTTVITVHYPDTYTWVKDTMEVHTRCDADLAPDPGYADSCHIHRYGGINSIDNWELPDVADNSEHAWLDEDNNIHYGDNGSEYDHLEDYERVNTWFTNPDKPIMKVVSENRRVKGYAEFWRNSFSPNLKIYVFGLGPYNKSIYEDQMDEIPGDTPEMNNTNTANVAGADGPSTPDDKASEWLLDGSHINEIERTKRIDASRQAYNNMLRNGCGSARYVDIWDLTLEHNPYFRYQNTVDSGQVGASNAQHGKWYDKNTYNWVFHMLWATILADNPNPEDDAPADIRFYTTASALTSYANTVVSPAGRTDGSSTIHTLEDVLSGGTSSAGAVLGYGDSSLGFVPYITTDLSNSSETLDYGALIGLETSGDSGSALYTYARYGRLLQDLGLDKTSAENVVSPRLIPGVLMTGVYLGNSGLSVTWKLVLTGLKALNPFQLLAEATEISDAAKRGMYDADNSWLVGIASRNPGIQRLLEEVGKLYDTLAGVEVEEVSSYDPFTGKTTVTPVRTYRFSMVMLYVVFFIAGALLFYRSWSSSGKLWSKTKTLIIRIMFILIGVPLLGVAYTTVLNGVNDTMAVTASPSSQLVAATFVDFGNWVKEGRLSPPADGVFVSEGDGSASGHASSESVMSLRKTTWAINKASGTLIDVDMTLFAGGLEDFETWDTLAMQQYSSYDEWDVGLKSAKECYDMLVTWMKGDFYYASTFESETMSNFSSTMNEHLGRRRGGEETGTVDNSNTLYQMFEMSDEVTDWMNRSVADNRAIFTGTGKFASIATDGEGESTDWHLFNIYANGSLQASPSSNVTANTDVTYTDTGRNLNPYGYSSSLSGVSVATKTGLSTLAMYNYLTTDFSQSAMTFYSSVRNASGYTSVSHYEVNLVGSGVMAVVFYLNCFVFMLVCVVIGFVYAFGMFINILKSSFKVLMSIPAAMMGFLKSIIQVIVTVVSMIFQLLMTMVLYQMVSELLLVFVSAFEHPIWQKLTSVEADAVSNRLFAFVSRVAPNFGGNVAAYVLYLIGATLVLAFIGYKAVRYASVFLRVHSKAAEWIQMRLMLAEMVDVYNSNNEPVRKRRKRPVLALLRNSVCELFE